MLNSKMVKPKVSVKTGSKVIKYWEKKKTIEASHQVCSQLSCYYIFFVPDVAQSITLKITVYNIPYELPS